MTSFFTTKKPVQEEPVITVTAVQEPSKLASEVLSSILPEKSANFTVLSLPSEVKANPNDIKASDDLIQRARNIVHILGFRGSVGDHVLAVYEILQKYERAEKEGPKIELRSNDPKDRIANALSRIPTIGSDN